MLKKLSLAELEASIKTKVEAQTGIFCYTEAPADPQRPYYYMEVTGKRTDGTKTMWYEVITVCLHVMGEDGEGNTGAYPLLTALEEAMTEEISLPEGFTLIMQTELGLQPKKEEETDNQHAVTAYEFRVCYGFEMKN